MAQIWTEKEMKANRFVIFTLVLFLAIALSGCGLISSAIDNISNVVGTNDTGTVIIKRAQIRSSYAVVAADLLEVKRGDKLDILAVEDFEKVRWYRVRAHDDEQTEGWIESQNVITGSLLDKSKKLAEEVKDLQPQATGQLRAVSNLRLSPEQREDNLIYKYFKLFNVILISWKNINMIPGNTRNQSNIGFV